MQELSPLEQLVFEDKVLISTIDNPFNPFLDFDNWYAEDIRLGHDTSGLMQRLFVDYPDMSDRDNAIEYARVVRELFQLDPGELYILVKRPDVEPTV